MPPNGQDICCVSTCSNHRPESKDSSMYFFSFPANPEIRLLWMEAILKPEEYKVCSKHFLRADIVTADLQAGEPPKLQENAVPIFFAPPDSDSEEILSSPSPSDSTTTMKSESAALLAAAEKSPDASATFVDVPTFTSHYDFVIKEELKEEIMSTTPSDGTNQCMQSDGLVGAGQVTGSVAKHDIPSTTSAEVETAGGASLEVAGSNVSQEEESHSMDGTHHTHDVNLSAPIIPVFSLEEVNNAAQLSKTFSIVTKSVTKSVPKKLSNVNKPVASDSPWLCRKCGMCFIKSSVLKAHLAAVHKIAVFPCEMCKKQFQTEEKLKFHQRTCTEGMNITVCKAQVGSCRKTPVNLGNGVSKAIEVTETVTLSHGDSVTNALCKVVHIFSRCEKVNLDDINNAKALKTKAVKRLSHSPPLKAKSDALDMFQCDKCGMVMSRKRWWYHQNKGCLILKPPRHSCETCGEGFQYMPELLEHSRKRHDEKLRFVCEVCGKSYADKRKMTLHRKFHTSENLSGCQTCNKLIDQPRLLNRHKYVAHGIEGQHKCDFCDKAFSMKCELKVHRWIHTGERPYICKVCGKSFRLSRFLSRHMTIHTGVKPFECGTCGKRFAVKLTLQVHQRVHTGAKPYVCETCGKALASSAALYNHKFIHGGIKPYSCETCAMRFTTNYKLRVHQQTHREYKATRKKAHTRKKPYKCNLCNMSFSQKASLTDHYAGHTGKTPFKCKACGKVYRSYSSLSCHLKVTHVDKEFQCHDCGKKFYYKSRLVRHQKTTH